MADLITQRTGELERGLDTLEQDMTARAAAPPAPLSAPPPPPPASAAASNEAFFPTAPVEPVAPVIEAPVEPPTWDEVSADKDFQSQSPTKKAVVFARWHDEVYNHVSTMPDWEQGKDEFNQSMANKEGQLLKDAGVKSIDEARANIARSAILEKSWDDPNGERDALKSLGDDIAGAFLREKAGAVDEYKVDEAAVIAYQGHGFTREEAERRARKDADPSVVNSYMGDLTNRLVFRTAALLNSPLAWAAEKLESSLNAPIATKLVDGTPAPLALATAVTGGGLRAVGAGGLGTSIKDYFKHNADLVAAAYAPQAGLIDPKNDDSVGAAVADGLGTVLATVPAMLVARAVPQTAIPVVAGRVSALLGLGTRSAGVMAKIGKIAVPMMPVAAEFATAAAYDARVAHLREHPGDEEGAGRAEAHAALETTKVLPFYMLGGAGAGAIERALLPKLMAPMLRGVSHFITQTVGNIVAGEGHQVLQQIEQGQPIDIKITGSDLGTAMAFAGHPAIEGVHAEAARKAYVPAAQDIAKGTNVQLKLFQQLAANTEAPGWMRTLASNNAQHMVLEANKFLKEAGIAVEQSTPIEKVDLALDRAATSAAAASSPQLAEKAREFQEAAAPADRALEITSRLEQLDKQLGPRDKRPTTPEEQDLLYEQLKLEVAAEPLSPVAPEPASPHDFVPALRGARIDGVKGDTHQKVKDRQSQDWQDENVLADADGKGAEHGFLKDGKFYTRDEASAALGEKIPLHSERLQVLQNAEPASLVEGEPSVPEVKYVKRTPEEKKAKEDQGTADVLADFEATGIVPKVRKIMGQVANNAELAWKLHREMTAKLDASQPKAPLTEGETRGLVKHPDTGKEMPVRYSAPDANGERTLSAEYTNNPEILAMMLDQGIFNAEKRLYIPDELTNADTVPPAISDYMKWDADKQQYYVGAVDTALGHVNASHSEGAPEGGFKSRGRPQDNRANVEPRISYTQLYRESLAFTGRNQKEIVTDKAKELQDSLADNLRAHGASDEAIAFHEEAEAAESEAGDRVAIKSAGPADPIVQLENVSAADRLNLVVKKGSPPLDNPVGKAIDIIINSSQHPEWMRDIARLARDGGYDWSKLKVSLEARPNAGWAGKYNHDPANKWYQTVRMNVAGRQVVGFTATFLHEVFHFTLDGKLEPNSPRNLIEQRAYDFITKARDESSRTAYEKIWQHAPTDAELTKWQIAQATVGDPLNAGRTHYGYSSLREFVMESLTAEQFRNELESFAKAATAAERPIFRNIIDKMKAAAKQLFSGRVIAPSSQLDNSMNHILELLYQGNTNAARFQITTQQVEPRALTAEGRVKLADANRRGILRAEANAKARDKTGLSAGDLANEISGDTTPVIDPNLRPDGTSRAYIPRAEVHGDGWIGPDGKFLQNTSDMRGAAMRIKGAGEVPNFGGHEEAAWQLIADNQKLAKAFEQVAKKKGYEQITEMDIGEIKDFMEANGFLRVMHVGRRVFFTGKPELNPNGIKSLTEYAKQNERPLSHDLEQTGPNSQREIYRPPTMTETESFSPVDEPVLASEAPTTELKDTAKTTNWIKASIQKNFTAEGNLPKSVFESWQKREGEVKELGRDIKYTTRDLHQGIREAYNISAVEKFTKGFAKLPAQAVEQMNNALLGDKAAFAALPEQVRGPIKEMRDQIDALSRKLTEEGIVSGDLVAKITDNLGTYMTRSYEVFDNKNWPKEVPKDVRNRAEAYILSELRRDNPVATAKDASRKVDSMLQDWAEQGDMRTAGKGGKIGSRDLSTFIKRQDITPVIRELLGEYKDPMINYARSVSKMSALIANTHFLRDVLRQGKEQGFLFEEGKQAPGFDARIIAEGSEAMAPIDGLRTSPVIAEAFKLFGKAPTGPENPILKAYMKAVALSKGSKTIGSAMTQVRNLLGQPFFMTMNGHYNYGKLGDAVKMTGADTGLFTDNAKWRSEYKKLVRLRVVDQSAKADELRAILKDADFAGSGKEEGLAQGGGVFTAGGTLDKNIAKATVGAATRLYQVTDDGGKMLGYYNEKARQAKINPEWSPEQVEVEAARRIRLTYPTSSMVPAAIQKMRRLPMGPFMIFGYEAIRTTVHNVNFAAHDIVSSNPAARRAGAERIAGQLMVLAGGVGITAVARALTGTTKEEDDDARLFMAPWDKNAQLAVVGKEKGKLHYVNMSYLNPYSFAPDTILAGWKAPKDDLSFLLKATRQFLSPFTNPDIMAAAVSDVLTNRRDSMGALSGIKPGAPIYNQADTFEKIVQAAVTRLFEAVEPGTLSRLRPNVLQTEREKNKPVNKFGVARQVGNELTGGITKTQTMDFKQAAGFKARDFVQNEKDADNIFRTVALREAATDDDIVEAYQRSEQQRFVLWKDMHLVAAAAIRAGITVTETKTALTGRGMTAKDVTRMIRGEYLPGAPSDFLKKAVRAQKRKLPTLVSPFMGKSLAVDEVPQG